MRCIKALNKANKRYRRRSIKQVTRGTHPKNGMMDFINYDTRTEINGHMVWAELYYNRELTQKEMEDFEMVRG